jgi:hypothetical protein
MELFDCWIWRVGHFDQQPLDYRIDQMQKDKKRKQTNDNEEMKRPTKCNCLVIPDCDNTRVFIGTKEAKQSYVFVSTHVVLSIHYEFYRWETYPSFQTCFVSLNHG